MCAGLDHSAAQNSYADLLLISRNMKYTCMAEASHALSGLCLQFYQSAGDAGGLMCSTGIVVQESKAPSQKADLLG